jgi:hypothetical protein
MEKVQMSLQNIVDFFKASTLWEKVFAGVAVVIIVSVVALVGKKL